ncbi:MAG TPA: fumarylacetoacetate hydrolase family protein [Steroidobacteraceae bacterium]|jgi:fumarylacetoacetate (FAA) hydrolase family protein|nr:fumarylacetoacetate hydrolase family protein [Steroidobacteraceae bacterium]
MLDFLPRDWRQATLLGRLLTLEGPTPVLIRRGRVLDVSAFAATTAELAARWRGEADMPGKDLGELEALPLRPAWECAEGALPRLLSPVDLQCLKACGVTFAVSALERVIEERARGENTAAQSVREALQQRVGTQINTVRPGSPEAARLKEALLAAGLWSQYLEVAIGPDAEIFTKGPVLSSVGWGEWIGVRSDSKWNNPEPEIVLVCDPAGRAIGATLGNDVNLRDIEGRSALLLGKAKDNNASSAIGPFIRLFDGGFTLDHVRTAEVTLEVRGEEGYVLQGASSMRLISRDPLELIGQTIGRHHQYPDGFALFLGTMFAPIEDRDTPGLGFTHRRGDLVRISSERLGALENRLTHCEHAPPWTVGIGALMRNLSSRGLLESK